jgi:hypothetical protein
LGCEKRVTAKNVTCIDAPVADTDVVRKVDITGGSLASSTLHLTGTTASTSPSTGTLIVDGGAGFATKVEMGEQCVAVGFRAVDPTRFYEASFSSSNSCATFHSNTEKPIEFSTLISQLYAKNTADANPANLWSGAIRTDGGITAAKRIVSSNATCLNAPVANTDVVRLVDIGGLLTASTYTITGLKLHESLSSPVKYTSTLPDIIIRRIYGVVTLYWGFNFNHTIQDPGSNMALINSDAIPILYQPSAKAYTLNTLSVNGSVVAGLVYVQTGEIALSKIDGSGFSNGDLLAMGGFTMTWMN